MAGSYFYVNDILDLTQNNLYMKPATDLGNILLKENNHVHENCCKFCENEEKTSKFYNHHLRVICIQL